MSVTPQKALELLQAGNQRFINNLRYNHDHLEIINETKEQQFPFACILSCSDSRVCTELIFDQGLGDLFIMRGVGNVAHESAIGGIEYACKILGSKLVVVMGHTNCGAIKAACDGFKMGNLNGTLEQIEPAVAAERSIKTERTSANKNFVNNVSRLNIENSINTVLSKSSIIEGLVETGEVGIIGAMYEVETGTVEFLPNDNFKT